MKKELIKNISIVVLFLSVYYLFPLLIRDTGSAILIMLILTPLLLFLISFGAGIFQGFIWYIPCLAALTFIPSVWIFYNSSALIYTIPYAILSLVGIGCGTMFHRKK